MQRCKSMSTLCCTYARNPPTSFSNIRTLVSALPSPRGSLASSHGSTSSFDRIVPTVTYSQSRQASRIAKALSASPGGTAETYVAYGVTQKLFEACSSQADYRIPQVSQKNAEVPKTVSGEDVGVGEGWWYEGSYKVFSYMYNI